MESNLVKSPDQPSLPEVMAELQAFDESEPLGFGKAHRDTRRRISYLVRFVAGLETEESWQALVGLAGSRNDYVRSMAVGRIAEDETHELGAILIPALTDPVSEVRYYAAIGLGERRVAAARAPLIALMRNPEALERVSASQALARIGGPDVPEALKAARKGERRPWVRVAMARRVKNRH